MVCEKTPLSLAVWPVWASSGWWWPALSSPPWWGRGFCGARAAMTWAVPSSLAPPPCAPLQARTRHSWTTPEGNKGTQYYRLNPRWKGEGKAKCFVFPQLREFWKKVRPFIPCLRLSLFFFFFSFLVEIRSRTLISLFMQGEVHSGSADWDDCGRMFPDKLRVILFPDRFPHYARTAA